MGRVYYMKQVSNREEMIWQDRMLTGAWAGYFLGSETWSLLSLEGRFSRPDMSACANIVSDMIVKRPCIDVVRSVIRYATV